MAACDFMEQAYEQAPVVDVDSIIKDANEKIVFHRILIGTDNYLIYNRKILELSVRHLFQKCLILLCIDELEYNRCV